MKLHNIMVREVIQVSPEECIHEAAKRMRDKSVGCLVVTVGGNIKGIITDRDLLASLEKNHDPYRCKIAGHMNRPVYRTFAVALRLVAKSKTIFPDKQSRNDLY
jgi:predicted transcriptional regulator